MAMAMALKHLISTSSSKSLLLRPMAACRFFNSKSAPPSYDLLDGNDEPVLTFSSDRDGLNTPYSAIDTKESLRLRFDMPGVEKQGVEVWVKKNQVTIKGERKEDPVSKESGGMYSVNFTVVEKDFELDQIKAIMNDGVLKVVVPKQTSLMGSK